MENINGKLYRHFKGGLYQAVCTAKDSETGEELVIYQALYGSFETYARPLKNFFEQLDRNKYPDSPQLYRFMEVDKDTLREMEEDSGKDIKTEAEGTGELTGEKKGMPLILRFLDAETSEEKLSLIKQSYNELDERTINNIEASLDIVSDSSDPDVRISYICDVLKTKAKYESNRLR